MYNSIDIPLFIEIEEKGLSKLHWMLKKSNIHMNNPVIITDKGKSSFYARIVAKELGIPKSRMLYVTDNSMHQVETADTFARTKKCDFIIGVGGGLALDISKLASYRYGSRFISIPTLPSHDGLSSPVASIRVDSKRQSLGAAMPMGIIVDLDIIQQAPARFIHSGIMDLLSNLSAIKDWELAYNKGYEVTLNGFSNAIAYSAADNVLHYPDNDIYSKEFLHILLNSLVLSGIAMEIAGSSRPASGAEHNFSHAYDYLYPKNDLLHGEKVGIGTLIISYIRSKSDYDIMYNCFKRYGLIDALHERNLDIEKITQAVMTAKKIRKTRYTVLNEIKITKPQIKRIMKEILS